ncbi:hypothetical protein BgiBS90_013250 [Biomphalaria glabrata]|nr:hypothetical protein BgiBS90_013250 [Biomphalaria glabrata]
MSLAFDNIGAWVFSPYCFCHKKEWLSVNKLEYIDVPTDSGGHGVSSGLSANDTALLAALILALALFLFLLYLLTCCLCPYGLCCGRRGFCCSKGSRSASSGKKSHGNSSSKVNLTAVDMKIPRPWTTESSIGFSDAKTLKHKTTSDADLSKNDSKLRKKGDGFLNEAYSEDEGWFSTSELDSLYGENDRKVLFSKDWRNSCQRQFGEESISMNKHQTIRNSAGNSSLRFRNRSYSATDIESLMTPKEVTFSNRVDSSGTLQRESSGYAVTAVCKPNHGDLSTSDGTIRSSSMNAVAEISFGDKNPITDQELNEIASTLIKPTAYPMTLQTTSNTSTLQPSVYHERIQTTSNSMPMSYTTNSASSYPGDNMITEISSTYKRHVIEETETVID